MNTMNQNHSYSSNKENTDLQKITHWLFVMFTIALIGLIAYAIIDMNGLANTEPYSSIASACLGFVLGTLMTGMLYTSHKLSKIKAIKARLFSGLRG